MSNEDETLKCMECAKTLLPENEGKRWRRCHFCEKPVCFDHIHYLGIKLPGLYKSYLDVVGVCKKCRPKGY